jgi:hypothetical protein
MGFEPYSILLKESGQSELRLSERELIEGIVRDAIAQFVDGRGEPATEAAATSLLERAAVAREMSLKVFVLLGRTAPIGLTLLGPVHVNILAFHILLMGGAGIAPGLVFSVLELFLIYSYRSYFAPIFTMKAVPTSK